MKKFLRLPNCRYFPAFLLWLSFIVLIPVISFTQVKFSAVCPNKQIGKNEYLQVQYVVENASAVDEIIPPSFQNFSIVSGPNQQSSMSNINGSIKQSVSIEFILKPQSPGTYTLPPASAKINGKTLLSNSLTVQVTNSSSGSSSGGTSISPFSNIMTDVLPMPSAHQYDDYILHKGENLSEKIKKNLFVKLDVNKTSCYVGEPVVATYKLYTRLKSESNLTKSPSFNGFSVSEMELPDSYNTSTEKFNGREYTVYVLRKVQLYPLQPGNIELDPIEVENHITFIKAEYANSKKGDIFYDMLRDFVDASTPAEGIEQQKITLQSKPLSVLVKPLPELNKPKDFKGAVGTFTIHAAVEKNNMTTDEAGTLTVSISGNGNMQMVNAPDVSWPEGIEAFDPKSTENIDKATVPIKGQKTFNYPFTVSKTGRYVLPAIHFSYFDINTQSYKTVSTDPVTVDVKKGTGTRPSILTQLLPSANKSNAETADDNFSNWPLVLSVIALFIVALLAWFMRKAGRKNTPALASEPNKKDIIKEAEPGIEAEVPIRQNPLYEAEQLLLENNPANFYYTLNKCLRDYLSVKLNFHEKELSKKKINELLDKHNVGVGTTLMLSSLLEDIEIHLYAPPSSVNQMQEAYEKASEIVSLLDKQVA